MKRYKGLIDWVERIENFLASFLLGVLACVIMMEVVSRYLLNHPFPWVFELTMFMITYIVFLGFPVMYKKKSLIILEFLFNRLSRKTQEYLFLIVSSYELQEMQKRYTSPTLDISFQFFTIPILFCGASILLFNVYVILTHIKKMTGQEGEESFEVKPEGKGGCAEI